MITIKLKLLRILLILGIILVVSLSIFNRGDTAILSIFGVFILMSIGILMEKERKKQQKSNMGSKRG
ncbi:hypothetical protein JEHA107958_10355 [Jeotgalicoccus halotolerans]|uniref:Uncharacterized protein n=1 Tax=Jeotgalicoccus halotolerans TaxID=157227 RepID=A0A3E0B5A4_9STAP|nr:hypothetical protein DFR63_0024 [Jeotgalicoccus halotolerans]